MGTPKAIVEIDGERLIDRAIANFHGAGINKVYVVLGAWVGELPGVEVILNPDWAEGMGSSLRAGLSALTTDPTITEVVVSLVDLPGMTPAALAAVASSPAELAMGSYGGKSGHPAKFARSHWPAIIESAVGDQGARGYLKGRSDITLVALDGLATDGDLDTPEDLLKFHSQ
jgi:nicotine blue oxidoreductase